MDDDFNRESCHLSKEAIEALGDEAGVIVRDAQDAHRGLGI